MFWSLCGGLSEKYNLDTCFSAHDILKKVYVYFDYFLVVLFVTPSVQNFWKTPIQGLFFIDTPSLLGSSTSKFLGHIPTFASLLCVLGIFFFQKPSCCNKFIRGPVLIFCMCMYMCTRPFYIRMISKHLLLYIFFLCLVQNVLQVLFPVLLLCLNILQTLYRLIFPLCLTITQIVMYAVVIVWCSFRWTDR